MMHHNRLMSTEVSALAALMTEIPQVDGSRKYYALTLTASRDGQVQLNTQTIYTRQGSKLMWEMRRASLVNAERMRHAWRVLGQDSVVVNSEPELAVLASIGGNAVVEESIFRQWFDFLLEEVEYVPGRLGEKSRHCTSVVRAALNHAPTRKMRMDVLRRDNFRCRICNRSPDDYVDIELHVHHVRPWGKGGLTEPNNLLTLCDTCHSGLDPHFEITLLSKIPDAIVRPSAFEDLADEFHAGVRRYRELLCELANERTDDR